MGARTHAVLMLNSLGNYETWVSLTLGHARSQSRVFRRSAASDLGAEETGPEAGERTKVPREATVRAGVPPQVRPCIDGPGLSTRPPTRKADFSGPT
jgi:hypothetical protein